MKFYILFIKQNISMKGMRMNYFCFSVCFPVSSGLFYETCFSNN